MMKLTEKELKKLAKKHPEKVIGKIIQSKDNKLYFCVGVSSKGLLCIELKPHIVGC